LTTDGLACMRAETARLRALATVANTRLRAVRPNPA
jgi:hypothetical protein